METAGCAQACAKTEETQTSRVCRGACPARLGLRGTLDLTLSAAISFTIRQLELLAETRRQLEQAATVPVEESPDLARLQSLPALNSLASLGSVRHEGRLLFSRSDSPVHLGADGNKLIMPGVGYLVRFVSQSDPTADTAASAVMVAEQALYWLEVDAGLAVATLDRLRFLEQEASVAVSQ